MSADPKNPAPKDVTPKPPAAEPNALAAGLGGAWEKFKQGRLIGYKTMAVVLVAVAGLGLWWYIAAGQRKAESKAWVEFEEAADLQKLEKIAARDPNSVPGRLAALLVARARLGPEGVEMLTSPRPDLREKAAENVEGARDAFTKLLPQFKDDPVFRAQCLLGLAKAEAALVGVKAKSAAPAPAPGAVPVAPPKDEYRGSVPRLIEYLDQLAAAAAPDTPWATDSKKLADDLRKDPGQFQRVQQALTGYTGPLFPPGGPLAPTIGP